MNYAPLSNLAIMLIFVSQTLRNLILTEDIKKKAASLSGELIEIRRYIHAHPELSFNEVNTEKYISGLLKSWNIEHKTGIGGHGIVGLIKGKNPDKKILALRADLDALPIVEKNEVPYKSLNTGVMHACGHDVHSTCLLGTVRILDSLKDSFEGTVKFIFQPAEEKLPGGAIQMIEAGVLENPAPDAMIAQHVYPELEVGKVGFRAGMYMASADEINLFIRGKGGHGAMPDKTNDTVLAAAEIIVALQKIASRNAPPAIPTVLSFGKVVADGAHNVIPAEVIVRGTFRTFNEAWRIRAHELISETATLVAKSQGTECEVVIDYGYPFLENNPEITGIARAAAEEFLGKENVVDLDLRMTAEDFASFAQRVPACFYRIGVANEKRGITSGLHTANFDVDEKAIEIGTGMMTWNSLKQLEIK